MAYDSSFPGNNSFLADFPPGMREQIRAIVNDAVVNALKLQGLTPGNVSGQIPISNGVVNANLNADELDGNHASAFAASGHTHPAATTSTDGFMSNTDKQKLDGINAGAEVNQNAFGNVKVGSTTIQADSKTDTLEIVPGANIAITPDATNDRLIVAVSGTVPNATTATNATNHINDTSGAHAATAISCAATGDVSATNVQAAIAELASEKASLASLGSIVDGSSGADKVGVTAIGDISGTTVQTLLEALKTYIDNKVITGTSATAAATAAKTVTLSSFTLTTGVSVLVKFTNGNTAAVPTLNVNSTGDKIIYHEGGNAVSTTYPAYFPAGAQIEFIYNGTGWVFKKRIVTNYVNGTSWYRIWSDGWIEQGGVAADVGGTGTAGKSVALLKTMRDTNYALSTLNLGDQTINGTESAKGLKTSTSSITLYLTFVYVYTSTGVQWEVKGY
jgi:hypothetical protein